MENERNLKKLELLIRGKMSAIKQKTLTAKDSEIGSHFRVLKILDEPLYESLLNEYKEILNNIK